MRLNSPKKAIPQIMKHFDAEIEIFSADGVSFEAQQMVLQQDTFCMYFSFTYFIL